MTAITLKSVPLSQIRCSAWGDWQILEDGSILALVRDDMYEESQIAVAIHEAIEAYLCKKHGISDESVVAFDGQYEKERLVGKHPEDTEPGDAEDSPYRLPHQAATCVERAVCLALGVRWEEHLP